MDVKLVTYSLFPIRYLFPIPYSLPIRYLFPIPYSLPIRYLFPIPYSLPIRYLFPIPYRYLFVTYSLFLIRYLFDF